MDAKPPTNLYTALLAAQRDFSAVVKNKQNTHLKNFYADLGAVLEAVTEPLANHGLLIVQRFTSHEGTPILITELVHAESGQSIASALPIVSKDMADPQKLGGAITYARRYSLLALLSLTAEDDDGNAAAQPRPQPANQTARQSRTTPPSSSTPRPAVALTTAGPPPPEEEDEDDARINRWRDQLATIRDDEADPKARRLALHYFYGDVDTIAKLNRRAEMADKCGLPKEDLENGYKYHHKRLAEQLAPASQAG